MNNVMLLPTPAPILSFEEAIQISKNHYHSGQPICLTTGCFDVLHIGHLKLLEHAASFGVLFVGINTDDAIKKLKGDSRPINTYKHRAEMLSALRCVNAVFPIDSVRVDAAILLLAPEVWIKGGDYTLDTLDNGEVEAAKSVGTTITLFKSVEGLSTTNILSRI